MSTWCQHNLYYLNYFFSSINNIMLYNITTKILVFLARVLYYLPISQSSRVQPSFTQSLHFSYFLARVLSSRNHLIRQGSIQLSITFIFKINFLHRQGSISTFSYFSLCSLIHLFESYFYLIACNVLSQFIVYHLFPDISLLFFLT